MVDFNNLDEKLSRDWGDWTQKEGESPFSEPWIYVLFFHDFGAEDQARLTNLASFLSAYTTCFHDGKLYYTYKITHSISPDDSRNAVVRNNAYDLRLTDESIHHIGRNKP